MSPFRTAALAIVLPSTALAFAGGDGSSADPYQIATCVHLDSIRNITDGRLQDYVLNNDIDCSGFGTFATLRLAGYRGIFDGNDFAISGLTISESQTYTGLFDQLFNATVRDLDLVNVDVTQTLNQTGGLAGQANNSTISNVTVSGQIHGSRGAVGGLIGNITNGTLVTDCLSSATVLATDNTNGSYVGGLVGYVVSSTVTRSGASGDVTFHNAVSAQGCAGGLVGDCFECTISESAAVGDVLATGPFIRVGGLLGSDYSSGAGTSSVSNVFATGDVSAPDTTYWVGGLGGDFRNTGVSNAFSTGSVSAPNANASGGFAGTGFLQLGYSAVWTAPRGPYTSLQHGAMGYRKPGSDVVFNDYNDSQLPCASSSGPECSTTSLPGTAYYSQQTAPMGSWDFAAIWIEVPGEYPRLRAVPLSAGTAVSTGSVSCVVGSPWDWDDDGLDDGCRGTNVVIDPSVTIPAGSQLGNNVAVMANALVGTGNILHNGVIVAARAAIGDNAELHNGVILGRRSTIGDGAEVLAGTVIGRAATVGDSSTVGGSIGYAAQVGVGVVAPDLVLGNLTSIGSATGSVNCPGPLIIARSSQVATADGTLFTCTGSVVIGPDSTVEAGAFGSGIRLRKNTFLGDLVTVGNTVRIGRQVQIEGGVTLAENTKVSTGVHLCDTTTPFSGFFARNAVDPACP